MRINLHQPHIKTHSLLQTLYFIYLPHYFHHNVYQRIPLEHDNTIKTCLNTQINPRWIKDGNIKNKKLKHISLRNNSLILRLGIWQNSSINIFMLSSGACHILQRILALLPACLPAWWEPVGRAPRTLASRLLCSLVTQPLGWIQPGRKTGSCNTCEKRPLSSCTWGISSGPDAQAERVALIQLP